MKAAIVFLCLLSITVASAQVGERAAEITIPNAFATTTLRNCVVTKIEPDGVKVSHDAGMSKIPYAHMPETWKKAVVFDAAKAKAFIDQQEIQTRAILADAEMVKNKKQTKQAEARLFRVYARVAQITKDGALMRPSGTFPSSLKNSRGKAPDAPEIIHDDIYLVTGLANEDALVDGDYVDADAVFEGVYEYPTVQGSSKRIHKFRAVKTY